MGKKLDKRYHLTLYANALKGGEALELLRICLLHNYPYAHLGDLIADPNTPEDLPDDLLVNLKPMYKRKLKELDGLMEKIVEDMRITGINLMLTNLAPVVENLCKQQYHSPVFPSR